MAFGARYICNGIPPQVQTNSPTQASSKTAEKVSKYTEKTLANVPASRKQPLLQQSVKKPESPPKKNSA